MARGRLVLFTVAAVIALAPLSACGGEDERAPGAGPPAPAAEAPPPLAERDDDGEGGGERGGERQSGDNGSGVDGGHDPGRSRGSYDPDRPDEEGNDVPPPPGSPAERFERTCERNPQECY